MVYVPRILAFAGSARKESYNKKVLKFAVQGAESADAEVTLLDLRDLPLPLYDGDLEAESGLPKNVKKLKSLMKANEGFLIASPEYNSSISGVLKNAIDWASRSEPGEAPLVCFSGKAVALVSATPGALAGLRGLAEVARILHNIGAHVLPYQVGVPRVHEAFDPDGSLKDPKLQANLEKVGANLADFLMKHYV